MLMVDEQTRTEWKPTRFTSFGKLTLIHAEQDDALVCGTYTRTNEVAHSRKGRWLRSRALVLLQTELRPKA